MCICIHIYIYIYMYVHINICIRTHTHTYLVIIHETHVLSYAYMTTHRRTRSGKHKVTHLRVPDSVGA